MYCQTQQISNGRQIMKEKGMMYVDLKCLEFCGASANSVAFYVVGNDSGCSCILCGSCSSCFMHVGAFALFETYQKISSDQGHQPNNVTACHLKAEEKEG